MRITRMKTFKQFITEIKTTKRQGVPHLEKMKDEDFIKFIMKVRDELKGKLTGIPIILKIDGVTARWGKDEEGNRFYEKPKISKPIYQSGAHLAHAKEQGENEKLKMRAKLNDEILEVFKTADFMEAIPNDAKMTGEILYNPLSEMRDDGKLVFKKVAYDKDKLGSLISIIPVGVVVSSTGEEHPREQEIIEETFKYSNDRIKIIDQRIDTGDNIDINGIIEPLKTLDEDAIRLLKSRKKADKAEKESLKELIQQVKEELSDFLMNNSDKIKNVEKLGKEKEGLIFDFDGQLVKVTSPEFRERMSN